jgi:glycosyltransferase involved in cell wall biosynthesis
VNNKLLLFNYYWPPSGGPAVQRWLSLTSELSKLGWQIWVVTVNEKYATYQMYDRALVEKIEPGIQVATTKTVEPFGFYKLLFGKNSIPAPGFSNEANPSLTKKISRFIRGNFFIPDPRKFWRKFAVEKGRELIKNEKIDYLITAGPPHSTHFIGEALKQEFDIKWVCDFHDLWTDSIYYPLLYHLPATKKLDKALEKRILEKCDFILTVGDKYKDKLLSKSDKVPKEKIAIIRIGYDEHLFTERSTNISPEFIISYIGSIAEYYHPEVFFKAIKEVKSKVVECKIKIRFVGIASPIIKELVQKYGLHEMYEEDGYVTHHKAIERSKDSTALLLINPVTKDEAMVIPGKIYEYLATGKPIINITTKDSETARLIEECNVGKTFERTEEQQLSSYILELYTLWQNNSLGSLQPNWSHISEFSRSNISELLDEQLKKL